MSIEEYIKNLYGYAMLARIQYNKLYAINAEPGRIKDKITLLRTFFIDCEHAFIIRQHELKKLVEERDMPKEVM